MLRSAPHGVARSDFCLRTAMSENNQNDRRYARQLTQGAVLNALGLSGKLLKPVILFVATWLFGPESMAVYLLALSATDLFAGFAISGYIDATTLYASSVTKKRPGAGSTEAMADGDTQAYRVVANALVATLLLSVMTALAVTLGGRFVVESLFPSYATLVPGLTLLAVSLVPRAFADITIAATKAHLTMKYDALLKGGVQPVAMLAFTLGAGWLKTGIIGVFVAQLLAECLVAIGAALAFRGYFSYRRVAAQLFPFQFDRRVSSFAFPQGISLTLHHYIAQLDVMMLAAFGTPKLLVAWYATAARLTSELRQLRVVFSTALGPVFARQYASGETKAIEDTLGTLSRWTTSLAAAAILPLIVLRDDIFRLIDHAYQGDSLFVALLLAVPLVNCAFGLAGNSLVFAGRSYLALTNNVLVALANTALNYALIPRWGLRGAAVATLSAICMVSALQIFEIRRLDRIRWQWRAMIRPYVGVLASVIVLVTIWDPAKWSSLGARAAVALTLPAGFGVWMLAGRKRDKVTSSE